MDLTEVVAFAIKNRATDIHLMPEMPPQMTFSGELRRVNVPPLSSDQIGQLLAPHVSPDLLIDLLAGRDGEFRFEIPRLATISGRVTAGTVVLLMPDHEALMHAKAAAAADSPRAAPAPRSGGVPAYLISLALLGIALAGAGLARIALQIDVIPVELRFDNYEIALLIAGILLIVPAIVARGRPRV